MPAQTADPLVSALRTLAQSSPDLKPAAQLYEIILPLLRDADLQAEPIVLSQAQAREKLARGIPLLRDEPLSLDSSAFRDLLVRLARALDKLRKEARPVRDALEKNRIEIDALLPSVFAEDRGYTEAKASELRLDSVLLWTLAQNAVKPAFRAWARALSPFIKGGGGFARGFGGIRSRGIHRIGNAASAPFAAIAALGELQGNDQFRHLRCGRCAADWESRRLMCVYCGNENPKTLGKLYADNQSQQMHAQVCDNCKGYLKVINAFSPNPPEMLAVHDLAALHLDFIAQKNGCLTKSIRRRVNAISGGRNENT
jgi:FdhE protein